MSINPDHQSKKLSRRELLTVFGAAGAAALLQACGRDRAPEPTATPSMPVEEIPTAVPVLETPEVVETKCQRFFREMFEVVEWVKQNKPVELNKDRVQASNLLLIENRGEQDIYQAEVAGQTIQIAVNNRLKLYLEGISQLSGVIMNDGSEAQTFYPDLDFQRLVTILEADASMENYEMTWGLLGPATTTPYMISNITPVETDGVSESLMRGSVADILMEQLIQGNVTYMFDQGTDENIVDTAVSMLERGIPFNYETSLTNVLDAQMTYDEVCGLGVYPSIRYNVQVIDEQTVEVKSFELGVNLY